MREPIATIVLIARILIARILIATIMPVTTSVARAQAPAKAEIVATSHGWIVTERVPGAHAHDGRGALEHGNGSVVERRRWAPPAGAVTSSLPAGHLAVDMPQGRYFFHAGIWYRPAGERYVVAAPPEGWLVRSLPEERRTVWSQGVPYAVVGGVYYVGTPGGWQVVAPPSAATSMPFAPERWR